MRAKPDIGIGTNWVDSEVICVITGFHLRNPLQLVKTMLDSRRVIREATRKECSGLITATFAIDGLRTGYSISIWTNYASIPEFGSKVYSHVTVARRVFRRLAFDDTVGPEIWSTKWKLAAVSNNMNWKGVDTLDFVVLTKAEPHVS